MTTGGSCRLAAHSHFSLEVRTEIRQTSFAIFLVAVILSTVLTGCSRQQAPARTAGPPEVGIVTLHSQPVTLKTELPGRTAPYAISEVRPQVSGIILKRLFKEGSEVKEGQMLYEIDPKPYQAAVDSARASLANAHANLTTTKARALRYSRLLKTKSISLQDYDDAEAAYQQSQANVKQQTANLETARINLDYTRLTAPISGRIGISRVTQGALVTADQAGALTTIQTLDPMYVDIVQSSAQLLALRQAVAEGQLKERKPLIAKVSLRLEDGTHYPLAGKLQFADITVNPNTGSVTLRAIFPNPDHLLLPGMFVRAEIVEGVDNHAILAPQRGVSRNSKGEATSWVVDKENKARLRTLTVSRTVGSNWLVTSGLHDGDRLIIEGIQKVRPGDLVRPVPFGSGKQQPELQPGH